MLLFKGKKLEILNQETANQITKTLNGSAFTVKDVKHREQRDQVARADGSAPRGGQGDPTVDEGATDLCEVGLGSAGGWSMPIALGRVSPP